MPSIRWDNALSVHNDELDLQHKELIRLYNELHRSLTTDTPKEASSTKAKTLDAVVEYSSYHFRCEEEHMESISFPGLELHRKEHQELTRRIRQYHDDLKSGRIVLSNTIIKFLRNWILEHVAGADRQYADFSAAKTQQ